MGSSGYSHDAPEQTPGRSIWDDGYNPTGRPHDGGTGAPGFVRQVEREALHSEGRAALAEPAPGGADDGWWSRGVHAGSE